MAALVQTYHQSPTMLQTRPTSASGMLPPPSQQNHGYTPRGSHQHRNSFHGLPTGYGGSTVYRGTVSPVQQYPFASVPSLNQGAQWQQQFANFRASSSPAVPTVQSHNYNHNSGHSRYLASASMTNLPSSTTAGMSAGGSWDDSSIPAMTARRVPLSPRPQSSSYIVGNSHNPSTHAQPSPASPRATPDRYRRPAPRLVDVPAGNRQGPPHVSTSGAVRVAPNNLQNQRVVAEQIFNAARNQHAALSGRPNSFVGTVPGFVADDMQLGRQYSQEEARKLQRRSMPTLNSAGFPKPLTPPSDTVKQPGESSGPGTLTPPKSADKEHSGPTLSGSTLVAVENGQVLRGRNGSSESLVSSRSNNSRPSSSANRNTNVSAPTENPALLAVAGSGESSPTQDSTRLVNIPPRSSSSDAATIKRVVTPSPLSRPVTMDSEPEKGGSVVAAADNSASQSPSEPSQLPSVQSPAVRQLSAINAKGGGRLRSKTSRLRRAFSFSSAAELRRAAGQEGDDVVEASGPSKLHKDPSPEAVYDAEQARIAQQQEAGGIGNSIYAGGRIFSGSTDNLSISSTASSASVMIRKMGRGMRKGGRSLVGLFRPKSIIGDPSVDTVTPDGSQPSVSIINVEAERERVNVNPDPHTQPGGGTGFPHLERNSIDTGKTPSLVPDRAGSSGTDNSTPRKSIVGGEAERAEVLASVRKGILKRGSSSSSTKPADAWGPPLELPDIPQITESPHSSAPSTPNDESQGHRRTNSIAIGNEDYFMSALRLRQDSKSASQVASKRNATFSPRIVFHDTWPSGEYDRRGEIATCNRLTPMLAQQIKEELNTFKMEMEVHENSKIYTHFF